MAASVGYFIECVGIVTRSCYIFELIRNINSKWQFLSCATVAFSEQYIRPHWEPLHPVFMVWLLTQSNDTRGRTLRKNEGELQSLSTLNPSICLDDLEKTTRNFYNISLCPDWESNSLSPALKPQEVLPLQLSCSITFSSQTEASQLAGPSLHMYCSRCKVIHYSICIFICLDHHHYAE